MKIIFKIQYSGLYTQKKPNLYILKILKKYKRLIYRCKSKFKKLKSDTKSTYKVRINVKFILILTLKLNIFTALNNIIGLN